MANYLQSIQDITLTSGNESQSFTVGELVNPYDEWADQLLYTNAVVDSGTPAPNLAGTSPDPFVFNYGQYIDIYEVTDPEYTFKFKDHKSEVHGNSAAAQTFLIPNHVDARFQKEACFKVRQMGVGTITVEGDNQVICVLHMER